jgi:hypothetical protein
MRDDASVNGLKAYMAKRIARDMGKEALFDAKMLFKILLEKHSHVELRTENLCVIGYP